MKRKTNSSEDYFLGGRGLSGWVAALSAQASDMSGWLLMGLPGTVYALGTGQAWIAVGLFLGTVFNWGCISSRLRRYTIKANNSSWGVKCMGRAWFSIWTGCPHVSILEEGKFCRRCSGNCIRRSHSPCVGLSASGAWGDSGGGPGNSG